MAIGEDVINGNNKQKRYIRIPDMFASFMSAEPRLNPHYAKVKQESEAWIEAVLHLEQKTAQRNSKADFTYLASLWIADADEEALRVVVDWLHWIFFFDDLECDATFATTDDSHPPVSAEEYPLRYVFQYNWYCFRKRASPELQERYRKSMKGYFDAVLGQVDVAAKSLKLDVEAFMDFRRRSIGVFPTQELIEYADNPCCDAVLADETTARYAHGIKLPQYVLHDKAVTELRRISADMTAL
ncbi:Terpenoid synthase [Macrophomina phaseolina MS6]|uniref:Terpenoid synthase n=1 Tax=Macrophomina phaseolina (strain MS6) TaxID=1126212 RepID=K2R913_MACPH|nr:Terpenoid synthase [Macrophomina phaseolina MS6]